MQVENFAEPNGTMICDSDFINCVGNAYDSI